MGEAVESSEVSSNFAKVLKYYRENETKGLQLPYQTRIHCTALVQQANHGSFQSQEANLPALGVLDVVGKDRRRAWADLGSISKEEAMQKFIDEVSKVMPEAKSVLMESGDTENGTDREETKANIEEPSQAQLAADLDRQRQEDQRRQIQDALNRQTFSQFKAYAETQFPNNPDQQAVLIRQLQEQHYHQYMQQVYQQQMQTIADETLESHGVKNDEGLEANFGSLEITGDNPDDDEDGDINGSSSEQEEEDSNADDVSTASMWTKKEIEVFKSAIRKEGGDSIIKVGHGETVTIRVPTHEEGTAIFWEFATDSYDIAFGLFFEWEKAEGETEVSVHISDSEDDDLGDEEDDDDHYSDPEAPGEHRSTILDKGPPTSVIVPIYRRDCHQEVYAGSHQYPGQGVYLLKFDNSYSLWRSKTLYYRVFYTK